MKVTVRFFAMFREVFQAREKDVVMAEGATIAGLLESLCT